MQAGSTFFSVLKYKVKSDNSPERCCDSGRSNKEQLSLAQFRLKC